MINLKGSSWLLCGKELAIWPKLKATKAVRGLCRFPLLSMVQGVVVR